MRESAVVQIVTQDLERGLEVLARYPADAPEAIALWEELRQALYATWARLPYLILAIDDEGLYWDGERVITRKQARGLVGTLANAGMRSLTIVPGAELEEITRFLTVVHRARLLTLEDEDDLGTLLWKQDFDRIHYTMATSDSEPDSGLASTAGDAPGLIDIEEHGLAPAKNVREQVREDAKAPDPRPGVVKLEKFDSTLYFLDQSEIEYLRGAIEQDYADDIGLNVANLLFDTIQRQNDDAVRDEVLAVLEELFPYLLGTGNYASAAHVLSECRALIAESPDLSPAHKKALAQLGASASSPGALAQLFHTLEGAEAAPSGEGLTWLFGELGAKAFPTILLWPKRLTTSEAQTALQVAVHRLVEDRPAVLTAALAVPDASVVRQALRLVRKLNATSTIETIAKLEKHKETSVRASAVETLAGLSTPAAYRKLTRFLDDDDEEVRVSVLEALAQVSFKGALSNLKRMISAEEVEELGLAEKRALFEAYGAVAGPGGLTILGPMLRDGGGLFRKGGSSDTRACAAVALGIIGSPGARAALEKGLRDRDPVVSNAARRALRGEW